MMEFDYGIIGGGPAGYTTAIALAKKGYKVILFEKEQLGGTCLNRGCIPTKSLLHSSEVYRQISRASDFGLEIDYIEDDFIEIKEREDLSDKVNSAYEIIIECDNEEEQEEMYNRFIEEGLRCRVLTL